MKRLVLLVPLLAGLCGNGWAASFSIEPFKAQMVPARGKTSQLFRFANAGKTPQAVQIRVESWMQDASGTEINAVDKESFAVYPEQFVLPPRGEQNVRLTWQKPIPETEQAFRVVAEQLPVAFPDSAEDEAIKYLLIYRAALYVTPAKGRSDVRVAGFRKVEEEGQVWLEVDIDNQGKAHTLLKAPTLRIDTDEGRQLVLDKGAQVEVLAGQNVLAGVQRIFRLPWPDGVEAVKAVGLDFTAGL